MSANVNGGMSESEKVDAVQVSVEDLTKMLNRNKHLEAQVNSLQEDLTMKEEMLRAHRRHLQSMTDEGREALKDDLWATQDRINKSYGR